MCMKRRKAKEGNKEGMDDGKKGVFGAVWGTSWRFLRPGTWIRTPKKGTRHSEARQSEKLVELTNTGHKLHKPHSYVPQTSCLTVATELLVRRRASAVQSGDVTLMTGPTGVATQKETVRGRIKNGERPQIWIHSNDVNCDEYKDTPPRTSKNWHCQWRPVTLHRTNTYTHTTYR
jgi:hypothetical protein